MFLKVCLPFCQLLFLFFTVKIKSLYSYKSSLWPVLLHHLITLNTATTYLLIPVGKITDTPGPSSTDFGSDREI